MGITLLVLICIILCFPILRPNFYLSHDGEAHAARFAAYFRAFLDGQFPPRWAGNLNYGYGTPLFIFFYPLPGYIASFVHFVGISYENTFKLIMVTAFSLAPVYLFVWLSRFAKKEVALAASIIYIVLPYRLLDTFVRGDIAEMLSFVLVPLIFLFIDKVQKSHSIKALVFGSIAYGAFVLSHNGMAAIFSPVFVLYVIMFAKNIGDIFRSFLIFIFGLGVSAFFWLPAILEGKYVYEKLLVDSLYKTNYVSVIKLFYSQWGYGPEVNVHGGLSPQVGVLYFCIPLLSLFFLHKFTTYKKEIVFWLIIFFGAVFMTTQYSRVLWDHISIIRQMGYPWRYTALSGFAACMTIFYFVHWLKNKTVIWGIVLLACLFSVSFIKVEGYTRHPDGFYDSYGGTTDYHLRTSSIWTAGDFSKKAEHQFELIAGQGEMTSKKITSNVHVLRISAKTPIIILDNTVYFPGWNVLVDDERVPIQFQDMNHRGLIAFNVPQGNHDVVIRFEKPRIMQIADLVSLFSILFLAVFLLAENSISKLYVQEARKSHKKAR
jgi:hypothetical protein